MAHNDGIRRYLEAGMALTNITRARAEELVRDLVKTGEVEAGRAQDRVEELMQRSRELSEVFINQVREEVSRQLTELGLTQHKVGAVIDRAQSIGRNAVGGATKRPAGRATAKKAPAKKAPAKKAPAKKAPAKKAPATSASVSKSPAKKAPASKTPAKKAPAKKAPTRTAAPRRVPASKVPARKVSATKAPANKATGATKK